MRRTEVIANCVNSAIFFIQLLFTHLLRQRNAISGTVQDRRGPLVEGIVNFCFWSIFASCHLLILKGGLFADKHAPRLLKASNLQKCFTQEENPAWAKDSKEARQCAGFLQFSAHFKSIISKLQQQCDKSTFHVKYCECHKN